MTLGQGSRLGARVGMFALLLKLGMTGPVAVLVALSALTAPIFGLAGLGLRATLIHDVQRKYPFQTYFSMLGVCTVIAYAAALGLGLGAGYGSERMVPLLFYGIARVFDTLSEIVQGAFQREERMDYIGLGLLWRNGLELAALVVGVLATGSLTVGLMGFAAASVLVFFTWDRPHAQKLLSVCRTMTDDAPAGGALSESPDEYVGFCRPTRQWLTLLALSLPLGVVAMELNLITAVPRYFVDAWLSDEALAVFGTLLSLAGAGMLVVSALGGSMSPRLVRLFDAGNLSAYTRLLVRYLGVVFLLTIGGYAGLFLYGRAVLHLALGPLVADQLDLALLLFLAGGAMYVTAVFGRAVDATRCFRLHMVIRGVTIAWLLLLVPLMVGRGVAVGGATGGLHGAAWAILWANVATLPVYGVVLWWAWRRQLRRLQSERQRLELAGRAA